MNVLEGLALLAAIPAALLLSGFWLAAWLRPSGPAGRLAGALLIGLAVQLLAVSAINYHFPLGSAAALVCCAPAAATLLWCSPRRQLRADLAELWQTRRREVLVVLGGVLLFFTGLFWPVVGNPSLVFWDGTSNHDSFFWITGAEHLKRHPYSEFAEQSATHPVWNHVNAIIGLRPPWGRMGAEGLLALVSAASGLAAIKVYVWAGAALLWTWSAAAYLLFRTFVADRARPAVVAGLVLLQPLFVFTLSNSNLPNLLGALCAALLLVATARMLGAARPPPEKAAWAAALVLAFHGLLCSYPELLPFALAPCGLLAFRAAVQRRWTALGWFAAAVVAGAAVNWISTLRAWNGFLVSFGTARANESWLSLFARLEPPQFLPALLTLSVPTVSWIGPVGGLVLSLILAGLLGAAFARARDRFGLFASVSGAVLLLAYTLVTGFAYGWQKTAQFGGVALGVLLPAGGLAALASLSGDALQPRLRRALLAATGAMLLFYGVATVWVVGRTWRWADTDRKGVLHDAVALRKNPLPSLRGGRVLVVPESFFSAFFHGMWATYLLPEANLVFSPHERQPGGYLRADVVVRPPDDTLPIDAVYLSREWADAFDTDLPRLAEGTAFALLREHNEVSELRGFRPTRRLPEAVVSGVPDTAATAASLVLRPVRDSRLAFALAPDTGQPSGQAVVECTVTDAKTGEILFRDRRESPPPWRIDVPLRAGAANRVAVDVSGPAFTDPFPLRLETVGVTRQK